jgi:hypothetical protein
MIAEGHCFLESGCVPKLDGFIMRASGEVLEWGVDSKSFNRISMSSLDALQRRDLHFDQILLQWYLASLTNHHNRAQLLLILTTHSSPNLTPSKRNLLLFIFSVWSALNIICNTISFNGRPKVKGNREQSDEIRILSIWWLVVSKCENFWKTK